MRQPLLLAAAFLLPLPAAAQLQPGFWSFPGQPDLPEAELAALCVTGFSLVLSDGGSLSYLPGEGGALWQDAAMTCASDSADAWTCEGWVDNGAGPEASRHTTSASTAEGALRLETRVEGQGGQPIVTWPQPCPPAAIRAALALGIAPRD